MSFVREIKTLEIDDIARIEIETFPKKCCRKKDDFVYDYYSNDLAKIYVLIENNEVIGYIDLLYMFENCDIQTFAIKKEYRGKGYGKLLLEKAIEIAKENGTEYMHLEVRVSNKIARSLYEELGFIQTRIRKGYYSDNNEDCIDMVKAVGGYSDKNFSY